MVYLAYVCTKCGRRRPFQIPYNDPRSEEEAPRDLERYLWLFNFMEKDPSCDHDVALEVGDAPNQKERARAEVFILLGR